MRGILCLVLGLFFVFPVCAQESNQKNNDAKTIDGYMVFGNIIARSSTGDIGSGNNNFSVKQVGGVINKPVTSSIQAVVQAGFFFQGDDFKPKLALAFVRFSNCFIPNTQFFIGRKRVDFGKVNVRCPRNWDYVDRPAVLKTFFGDHTIVGNGAAAVITLPTSLPISATLGAWHVDSPNKSPNQPDKKTYEITSSGIEDEVFSGRIRLFIPFTPENSLEIGVNGLKGFGIHHSLQKDRLEVIGLDLTCERQLPGKRMLYLQGEIHSLSRKFTFEDINRIGFYWYGGLLITEHWGLGIRYDWTEAALPDNNEISGLLWNITHIISPQSKLRLQHCYDHECDEHTVYAQVVFGIGTIFHGDINLID